MSFRHSLPHTQVCRARVGFLHWPVSHALLYPRKQVWLLYVYHSFWISNKHGIMYLHELNLKFSPQCDCSSVQPKTNGEHVEESGTFCGDVFVQHQQWEYSEDHTLSQEKNSSIWSQKLRSLESDVSLMSSVYVWCVWWVDAKGPQMDCKMIKQLKKERALRVTFWFAGSVLMYCI